MIPRILHKTGPFNNYNDYPKYERLFNENMKYIDPFKIRYRNDSECIQDIKDFEEAAQIEVLKYYDNLIPTAYRADVWRMCCLWLYGGIYSDFNHKKKDKK